MIRNSVKYVQWKDYKAVASDLKRICQSVTEGEALLVLEQLDERWNDKYSQIGRCWRVYRANLRALFECPEDIGHDKCD